MGLRDRTRLKDYHCFFVTTTCYKWYDLLEDDTCISLVYESFLFLNQKYDTSIVAFVLMPNHIHLILYFNGENYLSEYMRDFKKYTSVQIRRILENKHGSEEIEKLRYDLREQKFKVWMDRFDDVVIKSTRVLLIKLNYIHMSPVNKGWVSRPAEYPDSSAGYYDRGAKPRVPILDFGDII
ncbi:MAG: transposase [Flavobacteriales bacterium]|nr:transposase [Flavobacteriales bacterium]